MDDRTPKYNRVLLKLSGEALGGSRDYGIDLSVISTIAEQIKRVHEMGVQVALVGVQSIDTLKTAYPNYFSDTTRFVKEVEIACHGIQGTPDSSFPISKIS